MKQVLIILTLILLSGCVATPPEKKSDNLAVIQNAEKLGKALGCVFGSKDATCKSAEQKKKEEQEFIREFKKVDEASPSTSK